MNEPRWCQEGGEDCGLGCKPDPRFPRLDDGSDVLCEECYIAAIEEMQEELDMLRDAK